LEKSFKEPKEKQQGLLPTHNSQKKGKAREERAHGSKKQDNNKLMMAAKARKVGRRGLHRGKRKKGMQGGLFRVMGWGLLSNVGQEVVCQLKGENKKGV